VLKDTNSTLRYKAYKQFESDFPLQTKGSEDKGLLKVSTNATKLFIKNFFSNFFKKPILSSVLNKHKIWYKFQRQDITEFVMNTDKLRNITIEQYLITWISHKLSSCIAKLIEYTKSDNFPTFLSKHPTIRDDYNNDHNKFIAKFNKSLKSLKDLYRIVTYKV